MSEVEQELEILNADEFRPVDWKNRIHIKTGKSISLIEKVLDGRRKNIDVAIAIISLFSSEKRRILNVIEEAKK